MHGVFHGQDFGVLKIFWWNC